VGLVHGDWERYRSIRANFSEALYHWGCRRCARCA